MQKLVKNSSESNPTACCNPLHLIYKYRKRKVHHKSTVTENGKNFFATRNVCCKCRKRGALRTRGPNLGFASSANIINQFFMLQMRHLMAQTLGFHDNL